MSGLDKQTPIPQEIILHKQSRCLEIAYGDGSRFSLPFEYLRVFTPSAEARGHGPGQETLQVGKREVGIEQLEAVGNYALRPYFSDGHDTGIYSWDLLHDLAVHHDELWQAYLDRLAEAGASRDLDPNAAAKAAGGGCGSGGCGSGGCSTRH